MFSQGRNKWVSAFGFLVAVAALGYIFVGKNEGNEYDEFSLRHTSVEVSYPSKRGGPIISAGVTVSTESPMALERAVVSCEAFDGSGKLLATGTKMVGRLDIVHKAYGEVYFSHDIRTYRDIDCHVTSVR